MLSTNVTSGTRTVRKPYNSIMRLRQSISYKTATNVYRYTNLVRGVNKFLGIIPDVQESPKTSRDLRQGGQDSLGQVKALFRLSSSKQ